LKKFAVEQPPQHAVVYLALVEVHGEDDERRYVGQTENGHQRIVEEHSSIGYRKAHPKFLYFLMDRADRISWLLPISDIDLTYGPIMNILEQWISLVFRALLGHDLQSNMSPGSYAFIPADELAKGINIREPLAQWLSFNDWPMGNTKFKYSQDSLKREWWDVSRRQEVIDWREKFLQGDIFEGSFWDAPGWYGKTDFEFQIWSVKFRILRTALNRFQEDTIRIQCEFFPPGSSNPNSVIRGLFSPQIYDDPARRLSIKITGDYKGDHVTKSGHTWVQMDGDSAKSISRCNRLADWLEGLDTEELRPRRWYPANINLGRPRAGYTQHPADVGEDWTTLLIGE
jgi:hypothetical protein